MKKLIISVGAIIITMTSYSQVQCNGLTKDSVQCKNITKSTNSLCHLHNPYYVKKVPTTSVICNGITKNGTNCKNRTKDESGLCHYHKEQ